MAGTVFAELNKKYADAAAALEKANLTTAWSASQIREAVGRDDTFYLTAAENGTLCAIASCVFSDYEGLIANLAVAPEYRRRGIAEKLLSLIGDEAKRRGAERLCLEAAVGNRAAVSLYEKALFKTAGVRKGRDGDIFVMTKEITK